MSFNSIIKPKQKCDDSECPFHGSLKVRGRIIEGVIISAKMDKTVIVRRDYLKYVPKYRRYMRRLSKIPAHIPPCIDISINDEVKIAECKPISKTVSFVVIERMEK